MRIAKLLSLFVASISFVSTAQMINVGDIGHPIGSEANCSTFGSANNFQDQGGAGNYTPNFTGTTTFCPNLGPATDPTTGTKMSISFSINAGFTFDVHASDFIYVYDGPDDTYPLLGIHNSATDPTGFTHQATWNNPSGCLTVKFVTDGANEGTGWLANVQCGNPNQPFTPHLQAYINGTGPNVINPVDTGFIDMCFGDSIMIVASGDFPNSYQTTGNGYSQDVNSDIDFDWTVTDGNTYPNNDTIWFTPPARAGYLIDLNMTDIFPQGVNIRCKVRVSTLPIFAGTGALDPIICLGDSTELIGGVTASDTVGVTIPPGTFNLGGNYAGLTYLPDGSGQVYEAPITISGFPAGATIDDVQDLNQVCITMEHSYLGDLEIWLECPTGQIVPLVNSYNPGFLAGGTSGGGTFLGHPYDDSGGGGAGVGFEYCFSSVFNTITGSMTDNLGNTIPVSAVPANPPNPPLSAGNSIDPSDTYEPETTFMDLSGCPVNGNWTIIVQDNLGIDDGWIFEWGLYFDASFFPGMGSYQTSIVNDYWSADPSIVSGMNDTLIVVSPTSVGTHSYTFNVEDNFGCAYDTTITIEVQAQPTIFGDTIGCDLVFNSVGASVTATSGGVWSTTAPQVTISNPNINNPIFNASSPGTYPVTFTDNACNTPLTVNITYPPYPEIFNDTSICDLSFQVSGTMAFGNAGTWSNISPDITFSPSVTTLNPTINASTSGNYIITFTDAVCNNSVSTNLTMIQPPVIFAPDTACYFTYGVFNTQSFSGGVWSAVDTNIHISNVNLDNPVINSSEPGIYTVSFTDNYCGMTVTSTINYIDYAWTIVPDTTVCIGGEFLITAAQMPMNDNYIWNNGTVGPNLAVTQPGDYVIEVSNVCYTYTDTATIGFQLCDIQVPNIISLSSQSGNNFFVIDSEGIEQFECTILNRWGNTIKSYTDPAYLWDGKTEGGAPVEEGTYFYIIKATFWGGMETVKQGFVQVQH